MITNLIHIGKFSTKSKLKFPITVTNNAWQKINEIVKIQNCTGMVFSAEGGGCNGFNYKLEIMDEKEYNTFINNKVKPHILENKNTKLLIDPTSEMLLLGTNIDYTKQDYQQGIFENKFNFKPDKNLATTCGCGISFNPK